VELPAELQELTRLTSFAVEFRYDDPGELYSDPIDREWVREMIRSAREWADSFVSA
jgi:hypothetical protein